MISKYELREYQNLLQQKELVSQTLLERKLSLQSIQAQRITGMPTAHNDSDAMGSAVSDLIQLEEKLMKLESEIDRKLVAVINAIKTLPVELQNLFWLRYIKGETWESVATTLNYTWQHVHKLHKKGLEFLRDSENVR